MRKPYAILGLAAPVLYFAAIVVGGWQYPEYSHTYNTISELIGGGAPPLPLVFTLFALYNVALGLFGLAASADADVSVNSRLKGAFALLGIVGVLGLALLFFPQDARDVVTATSAGTTHIALAGASSLFSMLAIYYGGRGMAEHDKLRSLVPLSYVLLALVFVSGGFAATLVGQGHKLGGLMERFTIGFFLLWVLVVSSKIIQLVPVHQSPRR